MKITIKEAKKNLSQLMAIPDDLRQTQPCNNQVWSYDEVGCDPNSNCYKVVCTYKWCNCLKNGRWKQEKLTMLVFTKLDGQVVFPPIIVHEAATMTADLLKRIPMKWIIHASFLRYMDH